MKAFLKITAMMITLALALNSIVVHADEELDSLCRKFPHNSRCEGYTPPIKEEELEKIDYNFEPQPINIQPKSIDPVSFDGLSDEIPAARQIGTHQDWGIPNPFGSYSPYFPILTTLKTYYATDLLSIGDAHNQSLIINDELEKAGYEIQQVMAVDSMKPDEQTSSFKLRGKIRNATLNTIGSESGSPRTKVSLWIEWEVLSSSSDKVLFSKAITGAAEIPGTPNPLPTYYEALRRSIRGLLADPTFSQTLQKLSRYSTATTTPDRTTNPMLPASEKPSLLQSYTQSNPTVIEEESSDKPSNNQTNEGNQSTSRIVSVQEMAVIKKEGASIILNVAFSPNSQLIAACSVTSIGLWTIEGKNIVRDFLYPKNHPLNFFNYNVGFVSIAFSPDGEYIVSGLGNGTIQLWNLQGNPVGKLFGGHYGPVRSIAFSPNGQYIVTGSDDYTVRVWNLQGNPVTPPLLHQDRVTSVAFSPDGKLIVSGSNDGKVRLWDLQGNLVGQPFQGHESWIESVSFAPNGKIIAIGSVDKTGKYGHKITLTDLQGNIIGQPFRGDMIHAGAIAFSPDGQYLVSGLSLWDLQGNLIGDQPFGKQKERKVKVIYSTAFSPNGKFIASGEFYPGSGRIYLWRVLREGEQTK
ncbi:MAG: WD40 repeat domain-containing protein [Microcystis sp. M54BS1]|jgi:WD40 repeat protein|uniref:WD40 repeat domain-containing protein n=1 Tax=unclassified Microcystis TaxID=2643300 RepID=UPI001D7C503E|nr:MULTISPECIES: WD40 repeat domain-containing protein [unclassified Microcystis]MBE5230918.1 WD40 repeat domain-containing protein [Microcystis aeruginosa PMC 728.11]MCA2537704.1 WD40 repeat domain-containing protein [Microcystis sp. M54BS1]MCA2596084.1 WD40 repeat domain-containing protein [Microcystis sp. M38BS1]MCA2504878.1 WD40 repeat domain-containing protein [Microcystis sp. M62BS1]MCA2509488.1 WD40 repeat domain-containing protein [Microcystis sp. M60BS1]